MKANKEENPYFKHNKPSKKVQKLFTFTYFTKFQKHTCNFISQLHISTDIITNIINGEEEIS